MRDATQSVCPVTPPQDKQGAWNSTKSQCARLLAALRKGPLTTIEARRDLDILMPAARIFTLRYKQGKNILTSWIEGATDSGAKHRVARYMLMPDAQSDLSL